MTGPMIAALAFAISLIVLGVIWYRSNPVSAGRPGSLLVLMGALGIVAVLLCGCGENFDVYEKPAAGQPETPWHECMRKHNPTSRHVCRELK